MAEAVSDSPLPLKERIRAKREASSSSAPTPKRQRIKSETKEDMENFICALKTCSKLISPQIEKYVEVQAGLPEGDITRFLQTCVVSWKRSGEAVFHHPCWEAVLKSARARNQKKASMKLDFEEKVLIKEAAKTVEFHDSFEQVKKEAARIAKMLQKSTYCITFTGAGISTSAGIGDYRGKGGKWTEMDREAVTAMVAENLTKGEPTGSSSADVESEEGVPYEQLRPTYTHEAIAKLLRMGFLRHVISQNGDGLHGLSGISPENLSELHGNVFLEVCEKCGYRYYRPFYVMDDHASLYYEELDDNGSTDIVKPRHAVKCGRCGLNHRTGRRCEQKGCKGYLKDSIINFSDLLEETILSNAEMHAQKADLCLSLGTTMQVTPACELVEMGRHPLRLIIVNRQKTGFDELCYQKVGGEQLGARVFGDCDEVMREVMKELLAEEERREWESQRSQRMKVYDGLRDK